MQNVKWVYQWVGRKRWRMYTSYAAAIVAMSCMMIEPFIFKSIIDDVITPGNYDQLLPLLGLSFLFALGHLSLRYFTNINWEIVSQEIVYRLRSELFGKLMRQTNSFFRKNAAGDLITKCTGDVDIVRHFVCWVIPTAFDSIFVVTAVLVIFFCIDPLYALCLVVLTPITAVLGYKMGRKLRPAHIAVREARSRLSTVVNENINGNRVVKAFTREAFEISKFERENRSFHDAQLNANKTWLKYAPLIESVSQILGAVNLIVGGIMVILGRITLGEMNIFLSLAWAINQPMLNLSAIINDSQRFFTSCEALEQLYYHSNNIQSPEEPAEIESIRGEITMSNVSLTIGGVEILKEIDLHIKPGQTVGFMGPTGSGKTMLASLIPRFYDVTKGVVLVDGVNVEHYALPQLRGAIGMTMQDVFLFSASVEENVAYGEPDAPVENVRDACRIADADGFVSRMTDGYDTIVGERGTGLSGGQKQRISLARAILPDPKILILDDTTSAVDMETEKYIQEQLRNRTSMSTTLIIAQRVSSISHADCIYILDDGRIVEQGTHSELMRKRGYYYETCLLQQGMVEEAESHG